MKKYLTSITSPRRAREFAGISNAIRHAKLENMPEFFPLFTRIECECEWEWK